jgi:hypothetical protein
MRIILLVVFATTLLVGCGLPPPFTKQDLQQVRQGYATILPLYNDFKTAYFQENTQRILSDYQQEQKDCRLVDEIDNRDTIDPNTNLFQASAGLDDMCNWIEEAYAGWAKPLGYPYPKDVIPSPRTYAFTNTAETLAKIPKYLQHPAALS